MAARKRNGTAAKKPSERRLDKRNVSQSDFLQFFPYLENDGWSGMER